jgi:DNA polymerase-3 subunit epsilon
MSVLEQPLVFVDIETNGLNHIRGRVVEVAAIRVENGQIVREFRSLVDPGMPLPQFITNLTGITQTDLAGAPLFIAIADELHHILDGAIFVAHNVRFDYSFLKQEFKRVGKSFQPRQLCTMRLSRTLYPDQRGHKLQNLITLHNLQVHARHRAYDDSHALWQFMQHLRASFPAETLEQAIAKQIKKPSLPKSLAPEAIAALPEGTGVYIMYDADGAPLYVGKSIHIRKRVTEHFMRDHDNVGEFNLSQNVHSISAQETAGELEALLLESRLVKELLPYQNKLLRRTSKLLLAIKEQTPEGYLQVRMELASPEAANGNENVLAVYEKRSRMRASLEAAAREWNLCPKLLGLEKSDRACFWSQLGKCRGACSGKEPAEEHNRRLLLAFDHKQMQPWPYPGPILVEEKLQESNTRTALVIDRWCFIGKLQQEPDCEPVLERQPLAFDLDTYNILKSYLATKLNRLSIRTLSPQQAQQLEDVKPRPSINN